MRRATLVATQRTFTRLEPHARGRDRKPLTILQALKVPEQRRDASSQS